MDHELRDIIKEIKESYSSELSPAELLNAAIQIQRNRMIKEIFVLNEPGTGVPPVMEEIVTALRKLY